MTVLVWRSRGPRGCPATFMGHHENRGTMKTGVIRHPPPGWGTGAKRHSPPGVMEANASDTQDKHTRRSPRGKRKAPGNARETQGVAKINPRVTLGKTKESPKRNSGDTHRRILATLHTPKPSTTPKPTREKSQANLPHRLHNRFRNARRSATDTASPLVFACLNTPRVPPPARLPRQPGSPPTKRPK